ncbi:ORF6N domain-containing protein [Morganella morganii]|uniref:ORF6N domain-containing protein n=1 Tax=Morganella morganii TaxID=582 RepID=UPI0028D264A3|nr:ORF6N domain-containing protein [Morganella morganii]WNP29342.1 ORF6N domain-containing protein [Morganella morganii]
MDNVAKISQVSNSVKSMPTVVHMGVPVVTTEMLAGVYGTEINNIQVNFSRNKDRFIEGKHFHKLTGSILKEFKNWLTQSKLVYKGASIIGKHAKSLILWTERGAARHAKMLDTDQAWDVFEALEDFYFCKKEVAENKRKGQKALPGKITAEQQEAIKQLVMTRGKALPKEKQAKAMITMWSSLKRHFGCTYKEIGSDKFTEALSLAARVPLEGEYIPAQESLPEPVGITFTEDEALALVTMCNAANFAQQEAKAMYPAFVEFGSRFTGSIYDIAHSNGIFVRNGTKVLMDKLSGLRLSGKAWTGALNRLTINA